MSARVARVLRVSSWVRCPSFPVFHRPAHLLIAPRRAFSTSLPDSLHEQLVEVEEDELLDDPLQEPLLEEEEENGVGPRADVFNSIVKVFTASSSPNYVLPWQNKLLKESSGSGFVIEGNRILTNAHVVADEKYVTIRKFGDSVKYAAKVRSVCHECDLALLVVENPAFWEGIQPLYFGTVPHLQDEVTVIGFPIGGDNVSVTQGVVSRVEPQQYVHGATNLLAIQIDAAINSGNSGGPALRGNEVIGVAFQNLAGASNIGFIIPVPIINHFLEDSLRNNNKPRGFCELGVSCQMTENESLRKHLKLPQNNNGILVNKIHPFSSCSNVLKKNDVLISLDGKEIASDGSVHFRPRERIGFEYLLSNKFVGDKCKLQIVRDGQSMEVEVVLRTIHDLVPMTQFDKTPSYFMFAGLCFTPLTQSYLNEYGRKWYNTAPRPLTELAENGTPKQPDEEVVVLTQVFMDDVNVGYNLMAESQVTHVNGTKVINLRHLKAMVVDAVNQFISHSKPELLKCNLLRKTAAIESKSAPSDSVQSSITFEVAEGRIMVIDILQAVEAHERLLTQHRIPSDRSSDLEA